MPFTRTGNKKPDKKKPEGLRTYYLLDILRTILPFLLLFLVIYFVYRLIRYGPSKLFSGGSKVEEGESFGTSCGFSQGCYCCQRDLGNGYERYFDCQSNCASEPTGTPASQCNQFENVKCRIETSN